MELLFYILLLIVGFVGLIKGADLFVDGSSALARTFHVPGLIIGLTIVAMGTSFPELAVSTSAAISGSNEIALSNVLGSNIFNLLVVLGFCALFRTVPVEKNILRRDFPVCLVVAVVMLFVTCTDALLSGNFFNMPVTADAGEVPRWFGLALLAAFVLYILVLIVDAKRHPRQEEEDEGKPMAVWKSFLLILIGAGLIVAGGEAVVRSAKYIAMAAGMTETLVGLTIVAMGTSLPELVTSIVAARKGEVDMAVGNAVGSCIFNAMLILGVSSATHPFAVNTASIFDMIIQIVVVVVTLLFSATGKGITRGKGFLMLCMYAADMVFAVMR